MIGDGKPLFFRQPFLQPANDLAERLNAKAIAYLSTSPFGHDLWEHKENKNARRHILWGQGCANQRWSIGVIQPNEVEGTFELEFSMSRTIAECLEHARQCEWYAAHTNDEEDRNFLLPTGEALDERARNSRLCAGGRVRSSMRRGA